MRNCLQNWEGLNTARSCERSAFFTYSRQATCRLWGETQLLRHTCNACSLNRTLQANFCHM